MPVTSHEEDPTFRSHEERLQTLEGSRSEVASQLAAQTVQLDYMGQAIEGLGKKLEDYAAPISQAISANVKQVENTAARVSALETAESHRSKALEERRSNIKKGFIALGLAVAGAAGKEAGTFIWHRLFS